MSATAATRTRRPSPEWNTAVIRALVAYLLARVFVLLGAAVVAAEDVATANRAGLPRPRNAVGLIAEVLTSWDGLWYFRIMRAGYPAVIPAGVTYDMEEARAAFFPLFPILARAVDRVFPGGDTLAALTLNFVLGALVVVVVGLLAREVFDDRVAGRTMVLMAIFPGSFVLSFAYAEALFLLLAALCLLGLVREQWIAAGILAALGTATRPNGVALVVAALIAAVVAIRARRDYTALVAPLLAPIGFVVFQIYLRARTGEWAWFRVQREAWDEGTSFGWTAIRNTVEAFIHPLASPTDIITAASFLTTVALVVVLWRRPLPAPLTGYAMTVIALMILPSTVTARPRFLYTAFPLFIALAAWWTARPHRRGDHDDLWTVTMAASAAGLVALTALYGVLGAIP